MAVARVMQVRGGDPDVVRAAMREIAARFSGGIPEALPATGFTLLTGDEASVLGILLFADAADAEAGDRVMRGMGGHGEGFGTRSPVAFYDVVVDLRR